MMSEKIKVTIDPEAVKSKVFARIERRERRIGLAVNAARCMTLLVACVVGFTLGTLDTGAAEADSEATAALYAFADDDGSNFKEIYYDGSFI